MKIKLSDLKHKRNSLIARSRTARAQTQVHEAMKSVDIMDPTSEVSRFEEKVRREEARARGQEELAESSVDAQFDSLDDLDNKQEIESRLKALKAGRSAATTRSRQAVSH
jgi:phage shock protein A